MSRAGIKLSEAQLNENLTSLEIGYKDAKSNEDKYKKLAKTIGDEIKELFTKYNLDSFGKLSMTVTQKVDFNELKAIEILRQELDEETFESVVKTKEYIDEDALEKLAYNSKFDMSILASCRVEGKEVRTLRIKK